MTDKVQLIKEEIEKLKTQNETYLDKEYAESTKWHKHGAYDACNAILSFIDSLPEENHFEDKSEMVSEDLEEAMELSVSEEPLLEFFATGQPTIGAYGKDSLRNQFEAGAEWQKQRDQETIEIAEDHAMLAGMNKMKEEMMENAVYGYVSLCHDYPHRRSLVAIADGLINFEYAEKVKIIIVKEE